VSESEAGAPKVIPLGEGRYAVEAGGQRRLAYAVTSGGSTWVFLDGRVVIVEGGERAGRSMGAAPARRPSRSDGHAPLAAPMPATVVRIDVQPGQHVARGDVMILLEAMKMELPLTSPRDGTVTSVRCREGELVQPGVPLVELE
jgi:biotin carboxyl carrier protein